MNKKTLTSLLILDIIVMILAVGLIAFRYNSLTSDILSNAKNEVSHTLENSAPQDQNEQKNQSKTEPETKKQNETVDISISEPVKKRNIGFQYRNSNAKKVEIIGDFTDWEPRPLLKGDNHTWKIAIQITPGEYAYNFIVNGKPIIDPNNLKTCDVGRGFQNSFLRVKPLLNDGKEKNK